MACPTACEGGNGEVLDAPKRVRGPAAEHVADANRFRGALPAGPAERMVPTFRAADAEVDLQGEPLHVGSILQLTLGQSIHEMRLSLYVNGFSLEALSSGGPQSMTRAWSPFSLVEKCQVKTMTHSAFWAVFKLTVFRTEGHDRCYYFATTGSNAYKERDSWVERMSAAISNVTMSLFPPHAITVQPILGVAMTYMRIMAGYLLISESEDNVQLLYCELRAYTGREARLALYRDEWCDLEVSNISLADSTTVSTRKGAYCTIFGVDQHRFCARTCEEKELWLRAVSNVKVKLMFDAPDPTAADLEVFRAAVHERVEALQEPPISARSTASARAAGGTKPWAGGEPPLLAEVPRVPPISPRGDAWDPEPIDDGNDSPAPDALWHLSLRGTSAACASPAPEPNEEDVLSQASQLQTHEEAGLALGNPNVDDVVPGKVPETEPGDHDPPRAGRPSPTLDTAKSPSPARVASQLAGAVPVPAVASDAEHAHPTPSAARIAAGAHGSQCSSVAAKLPVDPPHPSAGTRPGGANEMQATGTPPGHLANADLQAHQSTEVPGSQTCMGPVGPCQHGCLSPVDLRLEGEASSLPGVADTAFLVGEDARLAQPRGHRPQVAI